MENGDLNGLVVEENGMLNLALLVIIMDPYYKMKKNIKENIYILI